jgi:hypothetical protein
MFWLVESRPFTTLTPELGLAQATLAVPSRCQRNHSANLGRDLLREDLHLL